MGEAFITRRGGGGPAGLNFEVVGGTTQPKNPKENTIWINTAQEITRWDFSAEHPFLVSKTKNFICYPFYDPTITINGVAYTDNGDGTVKANGTATKDATFRLSFLEAAGHAIYLPAGKYFLSGCPAGGSSTGYRVEVKSVSSGATLAADYGTGAGFELDAPDVVRCNIVVASGATVSNLIFKPQLEKGSVATAFVKGDATGQVWISTGASSDIEFNALKKNGIQVYPVAAKQYVGGTWANDDAELYKSGKWDVFSRTYTDPNIVLIPNASYSSLWNVGVQGDGYNVHTINQNSIYAKRGYKGRITIQTKEKQQLYDNNTITVNVTGYKDLASSSGSHAYVYIATVANPVTPSDLVSSKEITGNGTHSLSIGAGGKYYVGLMLYLEQTTSNWTQYYLELTLTSMKIN